MDYWVWLIAISAAFVIIERFRPRYEKQMPWRKGIVTDLLFLAFNGHFFGLLLAKLTAPLVASLQGGLKEIGLAPYFLAGAASGLHPIRQFLIAFFIVDFLHWSIHNSLHRFRPFWKIHMVHHSIVNLDWIGSFRFHWGETLIYKAATYPVLAFFGFSGPVLFSLAVVSTIIGHWNHANLNVKIGPLKYFFNNPEMHIWHHTHPDHGPIYCNFGINLAIWDWIFGTAHLPPHPPEKLAFQNIEKFPSTFPGQVLWPIPVERKVKLIMKKQH